MVVRTTVKDPDALQGCIDELAKVVEDAKESALPPSTSPRLRREHIELPATMDVVDTDSPSVDANNAEQMGAKVKQLTYVVAPPDETSQDISDDSGSEIGHNAADEYADETASEPTDDAADIPARTPTPPQSSTSHKKKRQTKRRRTDRSQHSSEAETEREPGPGKKRPKKTPADKSQLPTEPQRKPEKKPKLKSRKEIQANNYMTVMSIAEVADGDPQPLRSIFDQVLQSVVELEYQARQGTFGGSTLTTPSSTEAATYLKPFRELFGLEGLQNFLTILTDLRAGLEIRKHMKQDAKTGARQGLLPNVIKHLPATDVRCEIFHAMISVENMETEATRTRYNKIFALTQLSHLYDRLGEEMTLAELKRYGYGTGRGQGHQSLVRNFLIDLIWPQDNSPASREKQRTRLGNQLSLSGIYQALMAKFGGGVLLMVPDTWSVKRYCQDLRLMTTALRLTLSSRMRSIPILVFKHIARTFAKLSPELRIVCEQVYSISSALEEGCRPELLPIEAEPKLLEDAMLGKESTSLAKIIMPPAQPRQLAGQDPQPRSQSTAPSSLASASATEATSQQVAVSRAPVTAALADASDRSTSERMQHRRERSASASRLGRTSKQSTARQPKLRGAAGMMDDAFDQII